MKLAEANLLRAAAAVDHDALKVAVQLRTLQAPKARIEDAELNSTNAAKLLNLAVLRWFKTL